VTHLREEYSTFTWLIEPMLAETGFEIVNSWCSDSQVYAWYDCRSV
jgi:hypothetical protein